jgi:hypothetical protein
MFCHIAHQAGKQLDALLDERGRAEVDDLLACRKYVYALRCVRD